MNTDLLKPLARNFYLKAPEIVARELIGKVFVKKFGNNIAMAGKIVETEAYLAENDLSSHSSGGKSKRNAAMFAVGGTLYVYKIYGVHRCINVVTEDVGIGSAVLIRALEPVSGIEKMIEKRGNVSIESICRGPANLTKAFGLDMDDNFSDLCSEKLFISDFINHNEEDVIRTPRIGITKSSDLKLRFCLKHTKYVSGKKYI